MRRTGKALRYNSAYSAIETDPAAKAEDTFKDFVFEDTATVTSTPLVRSILPLISTWLPIKRARLFGTVCHGPGSPLVSTTTISAPAFYELNPRNLGMLPS